MSKVNFEETLEDLMRCESMTINGCTVTNHRENMARGFALQQTGWIQREIPWCSTELWDEFFEILGKVEEDWIPLLTTVRHSNNSRRGQILISPSGQKNLAQHKSA